jgi:hypothetical protein
VIDTVWKAELMRIAFVVFTLLHGLIHVLGFVKAFGLSDVKQLSQPISKTFGILWLLAFALLVGAAGLFAMGKSYWWTIALIAIVVSQVLIIYFWQDAKVGTIANIVILLAAVYGYGSWGFYRGYQNDVQGCAQHIGDRRDSILSEADIAPLPEPVRRYLHYTGCVGKPKVKSFCIEFIGRLRKDERSEWMPFTSEQYNFMNTPTRLFFMKAVMKHLPVAGYHRYRNGRAIMDIRLLSLFTVQYQEGDEMNRAETVTFFNDMCCMAPATLIDKRIVWLQTERNTVRARFTNNDISITADLFFNDIGELVNFRSNDRYNVDVGQRLPWSTPLKDYKQQNGYKLATTAEAIYTYPDKDVCYGTFTITSIRYNDVAPR